jgi:hypothetical protein
VHFAARFAPPIQDDDQARRMLVHYMGPQWQADHVDVVSNLIGQTGAFVREVAVYARLLAAYNRESQVSLDILRHSVKRLSNQLATGDDLLPHRAIGFGGNGGNNGGNGHKEPHRVSPESR